MVSTVWPGTVTDTSTDTGYLVASDVYADFPIRPEPLTADEIQLASFQDSIGRAQKDLYTLYSDYYEGRQRDPRTLTFNANDTTRDRDFTARHNVCATVIDIFMERLTIEGFWVTVGDR